jgi:two-component system NtrC family sensor kinase
MRVPRWRYSLKWRIVASYSLILILGGVSTSAIGIRVTGHAFLQQAHQQVDHGLSAARKIYNNRLGELRLCVELVAAGALVEEALAGDPRPADGTIGATARDDLARVRVNCRLDFLSVADPTGRVVLRTSGPGTTGDFVGDLAPIARSLKGQSAAATELVPLATLQAEDPALVKRASIKLVPTPKARPRDEERLDSGMALLAAAPVNDDDGRTIAVLYAGQLLNEHNTAALTPDAHGMVDEIKGTMFPSVRYEGRPAGAATIFQDDVRITTNVMTAEGRRALGTRVSREVYEAVMLRGETWHARAFVVNDWYISAYEPITNLAGERIGILFVGLLQRPYTAVRDRVTLAFVAIALFCFAMIVAVTYFLTRSLVRPLEDVVAVSKQIAAGDLSHRVHVTDQSELGLLSSSFNAMLDRIHDMNTELEQWAKILEQKVAERTEQLVKTQAAMDRQQRLASLGQLAAGVAHEINNPLGGILTFATLAQEEVPKDSPLRGDIEEIVRQADRCRKIVQELLEFSRQREAHMAPRSINDVVTRTLGLLEKQASFHDIEIVRKIDPDAPVTIMDESQMQQVFMNIVLNAADSMNERGTLTVETGHDREHQEVFVRISDTGCGIPAEIREAIFDPFFTTKEPGKGTGLGLAVACRIVQAHGGHLEVDSEVGRGSTFRIVLPVTDRVPKEDAAAVAAESMRS